MNRATIQTNGYVNASPAYPFSTNNYSAADLASLRSYAIAQGVFAVPGVDLDADWKLREWDEIKAILSHVSARYHYLGRDTQTTLAPRAKLMADTLSADGAVYGDRTAADSGVLEYATLWPSNVGFVKVAAGGNICLALDRQGFVYGWGNKQGDPTGQISGMVAALGATAFGTGTCMKSATGGYKAIAVAQNTARQCYAIRSDGTIVGWGLDTSSEVTNIPTSTFPFVSVCAGLGRGGALDSNGTLYIWGGNAADAVVANKPSGANYAFLAMGTAGDWAVAISKTTGALTAWGTESSGRIANKPSYPGNDFFTSVVCGLTHGMALRESAIYEWGSTAATLMPGANGGFFDISANSSRYAGIRNNGTDVEFVYWGTVLVSANGWADTPSAVNPNNVGVGIATTGFVSCALGSNHRIAVQSHLWICSSITELALGLMIAHGIPGRLIGGKDNIGNLDTIMECYSTTFNKWIMLFSNVGHWIENAAGIPQSLVEVRAHKGAGDINIIKTFNPADKNCLGYTFEAANGSGLVGKPDAICRASILPHLSIPWWTGPDGSVGAGGGNGNLVFANKTWYDNRFNEVSPPGGAFRYHDAEFGTPTTDIHSLDITYPLNNAQASIVELSGGIIEITLVHNMNANTAETVFLRYEGSVDGGETWVELGTLMVSHPSANVWLFNPQGQQTLRIRAVGKNNLFADGAGVHSPDIVILNSIGGEDRSLFNRRANVWPGRRIAIGS